jgi:hypothetical protein
MAEKKEKGEKKKLQIKDLTGKKVSDKKASEVKGGVGKIICLGVRSKSGG